MYLTAYVLVTLLSLSEAMISQYSDSESYDSGPTNNSEAFEIYGNKYLRQKLDWFDQEVIDDPQLLKTIDNYPRRCKDYSCQARCNQVKCKSACDGLYCDAGCFGPMCKVKCAGDSCRASCMGQRCVASCFGRFCDASCRGIGCRTECKNNDENSCYRTEQGRVVSEISTSPRTTTQSWGTTQTSSGYSYSMESLYSYHMGVYGGEWQTWQKPWGKPRLRMGDGSGSSSMDISINSGREHYSLDEDDDDGDETKK